jgi:hypothetical protein
MRPSSSLAFACLFLATAACGNSSSGNSPACGANCGSTQDATAPADGSSTAEASATTDDGGADAPENEEAGTESGTPDAASGEGADGGDAGGATGSADGGDAGHEPDAADGGHAEASVDAGSDSGACTTDCYNTVQDCTETDVNCGGACAVMGRTCAVGKGCLVNTDCNPVTSGVCGADKKCAMATCNDGVRNGGETGVDCGGPCAGLTPPQLCPPGDLCETAIDCISGVCNSGSECGPLRSNGNQCNYVNGAPSCASNCCKNGYCAACTMPGDCTSGKCSDAGVCGM